jgi:hypothetical protein
MSPLLVVNVSLAGPERDYDEEVRFLDKTFRIVRRGTSGDVDEAAALVATWAREATAIAVTGAHGHGRPACSAGSPRTSS